MFTDDNVWLSLHQLSNALSNISQTREERLDTALARFEALPLPVRQELYRELKILSIDLVALLPLVISSQEVVAHDQSKAGDVS